MNDNDGRLPVIGISPWTYQLWDQPCPQCGGVLRWWFYYGDDLGTHWLRATTIYELAHARAAMRPTLGACIDCHEAVSDG